jgi:putative oxidoreductase
VNDLAFESIFGLQTDVASLVLRLALGSIFIIHGYPKLKDLGKQTGQWLKSIGFPAGLGLFAGIAEFFGGIAVIAGILTPIVAALFVLWTAALVWVSIAKIKKKFAGGYELDLLLFAFSLVLLAIGGGLFSVDHLIGI